MKMKEENKTEKRLYSLVAYNLSDIQKGIQTAHAIAELGHIYHLERLPSYIKYLDWLENWKTIIVLNGGTSNDNIDSPHYGSLQKHRDRLKELGVTIAEFYEPDYNYGLTAFCFIVDMEKDWMILKYLQNEKLA